MNEITANNRGALAEFRLDDTALAEAEEMVSTAWLEMDPLEREMLSVTLPNPDSRPLLYRGIKLQLADLLRSGEGVGYSRIARITGLPYKALHIPDVIEGLGGLEHITADSLFEYFCGTEEEPHQRPINSTFRNLLLARELNNTALKGNPEYSARLSIVEYTWRDRLSSVHNTEVPELPGGYENQRLYKFAVTIVENNDPRNRKMFFDYGESDGDANRTTGEVLSMMSHWMLDPIDPEDEAALRNGLKYIADNQSRELHRQSIELLNLSKELLAEVEAHTERSPLPLTLAKVEDLNPVQIDGLHKVAQLAMRMWEVYANGENLSYQRIVPWANLLTALIQMKQPSTRTVLAAVAAAHAVGLSPVKLDPAESSLAKAESIASEALTWRAQNIVAILSRDPEFETRADQAVDDPEHGPIRISLGGNRNHPSQTLAEIFAIMEHYECTNLEELREATKESPPAIAIIGHTAHKRADQSLIEFMAKHLPEWKVTVLVPARSFIPDRSKLDIPADANYEVIADAHIIEQDHLAELTRGFDFVYISNAEGTANGLGKDAGFEKPDYYLSADVVRKNALKVLAPLPASSELDPGILSNPQLNHFIERVMQYKNAVLAGALLLMLASRQRQLRAHAETIES